MSQFFTSGGQSIEHSASASILPINIQYWLDLFAVQGTLKSLLQHHSSKASILWWESLGLQGDQTSQSYRKSVMNIHWKDWCWSSKILGREKSKFTSKTEHKSGISRKQRRVKDICTTKDVTGMRLDRPAAVILWKSPTNAEWKKFWLEEYISCFYIKFESYHGNMKWLYSKCCLWLT